MADIELVIKIPEGAKQAFDRAESNDLIGCYYDPGGVIGNAIKNGTPLPKGHGRLIDADRTALLSDLFCYTKYTGIDEAPYEDATEALAFAPTIVEADKESEGEQA